MRFCVFALSTLPDVPTARRMQALDELDDKSVVKVIHHNHRQRVGKGKPLGLEQRMLAGLTLIQHSVDKFQIDSMSLADHTEPAMLKAFFVAALRNGRMVSWGGKRGDVALIHLRSLIHDISYPAYWQADDVDEGIHLDIERRIVSTSDPDQPMLRLDDMARRLGYPGLLRWHDVDPTSAWLEGRRQELQAHTELGALNIYLTALRLFATTGEMPQHDVARVKGKLRDDLARRDQGHLTDFLAAWRT